MSFETKFNSFSCAEKFRVLDIDIVKNWWNEKVCSILLQAYNNIFLSQADCPVQSVAYAFLMTAQDAVTPLAAPHWSIKDAYCIYYTAVNLRLVNHLMLKYIIIPYYIHNPL